MTKEDLVEGVDVFFSGEYEITDGRVIPDVDDIAFGKNGKEMELAMLFIDIRESTKIVDGLRRTTAAKMYKSFLWGVAKIARINDGELRSFNGDGVLVAFSGEQKRTNAAKAALQMSWFAKKVLKPKLDAVFQNNEQLCEDNIEFDFGIGIDVGKVLIVRGGIRGENNNDLVWVGNATNYAVKLSNCSNNGYSVYISKEAYESMSNTSKLAGEKNMWEKVTRNDLGGITAYKSNYTWPL